MLTQSYSSADWAARDSRARDCHYRIKKWPLRSETTVGQRTVAHPALGDKSKIYLPPLHIKLGLIKICVKAMDEESDGFDYYLRQSFPNEREAKKKDGIFVGPQITQIFEAEDIINIKIKFCRQKRLKCILKRLQKLSRQ